MPGGISLRYGPTLALDRVEFTLEPGQILCLLGPSGCGKTSLLRVIAGLEFPDEGHLTLARENLLPIPTHQRGIGLMFQDFALFPHLNVAENVRFGLKMAGLSREERERRTAAVLDQVGMASFAKRDVAQLSGGEKQRVALARSLAPQPHLLLLDEPLGSLDANTRENLVEEIRNLIQAAGLAAIYVTHDRGEAFAIADQIAVMNRGRLLQIDTPAQLYQAPRTPFVAHFFGQENIVPVIAADPSSVETAFGQFALKGQPKHILIHSQGITLAPSQSTDAVTGIVQGCTFRGTHYEVRSEHHGQILKFAMPSKFDSPPQPGDPIQICIDPSFVISLEND